MSYPKEIQKLALFPKLQEVIDNALYETTSSVVASTGSGKTVSLCVGLYIALLLRDPKKEPLQVMISFPTCMAVDMMYDYVQKIIEDNKLIKDDVPRLAKIHGKHRHGDVKTALVVLGTTGSILNYLLKKMPPKKERTAEAMKGCLSRYRIVVDECHVNSPENSEILRLLRWLVKMETGVHYTTATATPDVTHDKPDKIVTVDARTHKITKHWGFFTKHSWLSLAEYEWENELISKVTSILHSDKKGNILVFVPLVSMAENLAEKLAKDHKASFALHGKMTHQEQNQVMKLPKGVQTVIFATNVVEQSVTGDFDIVVDSCLTTVVETKQRGRQEAKTILISQAEGNQRAGRTGRLRPGDVYSMINKFSFDEMLRLSPVSAFETNGKEHSVFRFIDGGMRCGEIKEILSLDEDELKLTLGRLGHLGLITPEPKGESSEWTDRFPKLDLDDDVTITDLGREVIHMPISLDYAATLLKLRNELKLTYADVTKGSDTLFQMLYGLCAISVLESKLTNRFVVRIPRAVGISDRLDFITSKMPDLTDVSDDVSFFTNILLAFMTRNVDRGGNIKKYYIAKWCRAHFVSEKFLRGALRILNLLWSTVFDSSLEYGYYAPHFEILLKDVKHLQLYQLPLYENLVTTCQPLHLRDTEKSSYDSWIDESGKYYRLDTTSLAGSQRFVFALSSIETGKKSRFTVMSDCFIVPYLHDTFMSKLAEQSDSDDDYEHEYFFDLL